MSKRILRIDLATAALAAMGAQTAGAADMSMPAMAAKKTAPAAADPIIAFRGERELQLKTNGFDCV